MLQQGHKTIYFLPSFVIWRLARTALGGRNIETDVKLILRILFCNENESKFLSL